VSFLHEIGATVHRQEILIVEAADAGIPAAAAADGTHAANPLEIVFQQSGIVIEVTAVSALALARCLLFAGVHPPGQIRDEKSHETHRITAEDFKSVVDRG
jgi:metal-dependent HD superfamily phosphatase/phosphodiesterase